MIFADMSQLPLLLVKYHQVPVASIGWYLLPLFLAYIAATLLNSKLQRILFIDSVIALGLLLIAVGM